MSEKTATLIGATGLIGGELLSLLLDDDYFKKVRILIRRPFTMNHPKLERKLVDFSDADSLLVDLDESDVVFCEILEIIDCFLLTPGSPQHQYPVATVFSHRHRSLPFGI